jgi:1-acyl-sn-glycerol-3-phosphate acyltransferase
VTDLPDGAYPRLHDLGRFLARQLYRPGFRIHVHGRERVPRTGGLLVVANHSSMIEPQLIFGMMPRRSVFLVKSELFTGVLGRALRALGQIPVHRGEPDRASLLTAVRLLRAGGAVGVFPEGTRGTGDVTSAERGAAWLARASGAAVLPVATRGTLRPPGGGRRFRPRVDLLIGEPFGIAVGPGRTGLGEATEHLRGELAALVRTLDAWRAAHVRES